MSEKVGEFMPDNNYLIYSLVCSFSGRNVLSESDFNKLFSNLDALRTALCVALTAAGDLES